MPPSAAPPADASVPDDVVAFGPRPAPGAVRVTHPGRAALLAELGRRLHAREGFTLATLNLDHVVKLRADPLFLAAYRRHSHVVADGNPIVWLSRLAGRGDVELVPGSELVAPLAALARREGAPVALLGATEAALARAARRLEADHPGLRIALRHAPPMGFDPEGAPAEAAVAALERAAPAGLCLLALGAPRQERFAAFAAPRLPGWGFASVGAGVDFVAGDQRRAPPLARRLALEWLWRAAGDPRRLGARYARCALILPGLARRARAARSR